MAEKPPEKTGRFDTGLIRELAAILREADLGEIEIEQGGMRIKVVKPKAKTVHMAQAYAPAPAAAAAPSAAPAASAAPVSKASLRDHPGAVKSPMVGTVYLQAEERRSEVREGWRHRQRRRDAAVDRGHEDVQPGHGAEGRQGDPDPDRQSAAG